MEQGGGFAHMGQGAVGATFVHPVEQTILQAAAGGLGTGGMLQLIRERPEQIMEKGNIRFQLVGIGPQRKGQRQHRR